MSASILLGGLAVGLPSVAQTAGGESSVLEEVVVTAEHRESTAQRTAASVSVRAGDDLLAQGKYSLTNILEDVPGIVGGAAERTSGSLGSGTDNPAAGLTIRGIQSNAGAGGSVTSTAAAAAIYVDGVYNGVGGGYDIERVEALKGPQGTLYGRSATSGVVAIKTKDPKADKLSADISVEAGSYALRHVSGGITVPVIQDKLAVRISGNRFERDGYYAKEGDKRSSSDARVKVLFTPTDNFSALLGYALQDNKTHTGGVTITQVSPDNFTFAPSATGSGENRYRQYWGEFNLDVGPVAVTYIPALRTWYQDAVIVNRGGGVPSFDQTVYTPTDRFITHELRLHSNTESVLQWQAGLFSYQNKLHDRAALVLVPSNLTAFKTESRKTTEAVGGFAEATWSIQPETRLTAGLRFDHTEVQNNQDYTSITGTTKSLSGAEGLRKFDNTTYKLRLEHDLAPGKLVYGSIATGFSPGDVSVTTDVSGQPTVVELDAQILTAYELGSKNRFLDGHLQVNGAAYYNDYGGYQSAGLNLTPNGFSPTYQTVTTPVKVYGFEIEMLAAPWTDGQFGLNLSYTHARYDSVPAQYAFLFGRRTIPGVIPFEASLSYDHRLDVGGDSELMLHGDLQYNSKYDASRLTVENLQDGGLPYVQRGAQVVGNVSATWSMAQGRYSVTGYVRNIADSREKLGATLGYTNGVLTSAVQPTLQDPRTYGVVLNARF